LQLLGRSILGVIRLIFILLALALALAVAACDGGDRTAADTARFEATSVPAKPAPPTSATAVEVVDGDTSKPVRGARVVVSGRQITAVRGRAALGVPRHRVLVRVLAPGYSGQRVRLDFRRHLVQRVKLWRPSLQWPMYGVNDARTQVQARIKVRPPFRVVWKRSLHGLLEFPAVVWEGVAYVSNMYGVLRAISMEDGRVLWSKREGSLMASSPAIDPKRRVLVTTSMEPGYATVRSLDTGRRLWRYDTGRSEPSPVIRGGVAYLGATNGNVYALDLDRHRARWVFHGGVKITSSAALVGRRLYFGDYAGRVFALNARTGRVVWRGSAGSRVYGTVAVSGGRVFAPSVFSGLSALSARNGRLLWRLPVGDYLYSSPAVFRGRVYFGTYEWLVYSVSTSSGHVYWRRPAGGAVSAAVQVVGNAVYASSLRGRTTAWNWRTGRQIWSFPRGKYVPISGSGRRLLVHGATTLFAVEHKRHR
jgi:outer membrane protein assembly factor BamB